MRSARALTCALALAAGSAVACGGVRAESKGGAEGAVERRTVEDVFLLTGELAAVRAVELAVPRLAGMDGGMQVKWIAQDGAEVAKDDVVVELDNGRVSSTLEERRTRAAQGAIALEQRQAVLDADRSVKAFEVEKTAVALAKAKVEAEVPVELRAKKDWHEKQQALVKAEAAHDKARLTLGAHDRSAAADLKVLGIALDKARREVAQSEESLKGLQLRAPRPGVVLLGRSPNEDRPVQLGDNLWPGLRAASLPDLSELEVAAFLPEVDDGRVLAGQTARVILDSALDRVHEGRVESVAAVAQDARYAGGFRVRVSLAKTDSSSMRPGLSARVEVVRRSFKDALVVPRAAVSWQDQQARVARPGGGFTEVTLSACLALECVIEAAFPRETVSPFAELARLSRGRRGLVLAGLVGALALAGVSWSSGARNGLVPTAVARLDALLETVDVDGEIAAVGSLDLGPPMVPDLWDYKIAFLADEGTSVKSGQPVVRFDPGPLQRQLDEKQAEFEEAAQKISRGRLESNDKGRDLDLQLAEARSRLQKAQTKDEIPPELRSRIEVQQATLERTLAEKEVASLEERRKSVGTAGTASLRSLIAQRDRALGRVAALRSAIEKMTVTAPQDGIVIYKTMWSNEKRKVGDTVWWGEKLIALPDLNKLRAEGDVDEADGGAIAAGQRVTLRLEALPNRDFEATVSRIGSTVRRKSPRVPSKVFRVEIAFAKADPALRPAMRFRGEIEIARGASVLQIPREAVFFRSSGPVVYTRGFRGFTAVPVKLGRTGRANVEVLKGLREGDVVALTVPEGKA